MCSRTLIDRLKLIKGVEIEFTLGNVHYLSTGGWVRTEGGGREKMDGDGVVDILRGQVF